MEPSVDPLSETTTSPRILESRNAVTALSTHMAIDFTSFRQGITTDTSGSLLELELMFPKPSDSTWSSKVVSVTAVMRSEGRTDRFIVGNAVFLPDFAGRTIERGASSEAVAWTNLFLLRDIAEKPSNQMVFLRS